jgi:hypothetical protein
MACKSLAPSYMYHCVLIYLTEVKRVCQRCVVGKTIIYNQRKLDNRTFISNLVMPAYGCTHKCCIVVAVFYTQKSFKEVQQW